MDSLRHCLKPGERLLWSGRPAQGLLLTLTDLFLVPFSLLWSSLPFSMVLTAGSTTFPMFIWLFAVVGFYITIGRFLVDAWIRAGMSYAVTDRRVLILRKWPFHNLRSLALDDLGDVELRRRLGGSGTIRLGATDWRGMMRGFEGWSPAMSRAPQFLAIRDAASVFDLILEARHRD